MDGRDPDECGGSIQGRNRFAREVVRDTVATIGARRVGIRLSPYSVFTSTSASPDVEAQYLTLTEVLAELLLRPSEV